MLVLLSPAKNLNFDPAPADLPATEPVLAGETATLSKTTRRLSRAKLRQLMGISDNLADLNYQRFQAFDPDGAGEGTKQAALAFNGDVYLGLDANSLSVKDLEWAQDHLRMLSGLYGVLRPLDAIQPYRLEMGTKLKTRRGETLYRFWGDRISNALNEDLGDDEIVLNLASNEYFKAVDKKALKARVVECVFWEEKAGKARPLFMYTKRARGLMARYVVKNRITDLDAVKAFDVEGYAFDAAASTEDKLVFTRPQPKPKG